MTENAEPVPSSLDRWLTSWKTLPLNSELARSIFEVERLAVYRSTDYLFGWLMIIQCLAAILIAATVSPLAWAGRDSYIHPHIYFATILGSLITLFPAYLAFRHSGEPLTRHTIAACQMLYSGLLIHLTGGRIETHFHIFGSLAFLSFYRDWRVLLTASGVTMVDHALRGMLIPESIYGVAVASPWRTLEHVWWVIFEDVFLLNAGHQSIHSMVNSANEQAELRETRARVEEIVTQRTEELSRSESRYRALCETAPVGIFLTSQDGDCVYVNNRFCEIYNITAEQATEEGWADVVAEVDFDYVKASWLNAVGGNGIFDVQYRLKGDKVCWVHVVATRVRSEDGSDQNTFVGTAEVITERVLAEQEQREKELVHAQLASIVRHSNDSIIGKNNDGTVVSWNPAAERLFGYSSEEMIGKKITIILPDSRASEDGVIDDRVRSGMKVDDFETVRMRKDGTCVDVALTYSLMVDEKGIPFGASSIYRDISQRKEVEKRLSEFYSTISHELRTPLTSIRGALGLIDDEIIEMGSEECAEMIKVARSSSERLVRLINDILDIKKIEAGKLELRLEKIDATSLVSRAVSAMEGMALANNVHLLKDTDHGATVEVDVDRILQVLTNLISNAIKFSKPNHSVNVALAIRSDGSLRFSVTDEGEGIPLPLQSKLFQRFQQVDSSDTRAKEGTGLGLALCKAIVEEHKGLIGLHSSEITGSTFWFDLPTVDVAKRIIANPHAGSSTILLVEDDDNLAQFMRLVLRKAGYQTIHATGIQEAIESITNHVPSLILLDLRLPDGTGLEILQFLKDKHPDANVPVIVTTGQNLDQLSLSYPVLLDCFFKPLEINQLLATIEKAIVKSTSRRVLLVEDDVESRSVIAAQLRSIGAICMEAHDGAEALTLTESFQPDLIILDVGLPKLSGFEVISALQKGPFALVPLLVYSGQELDDKDRRKLTLGLTKYLNKGRVSPQEFVRSVQEILDQLSVLDGRV